jgi:hypothetical protein
MTLEGWQITIYHLSKRAEEFVLKFEIAHALLY